MRRATILALATFVTGFTFLDPVAEKNREGNALFREGKFDVALEKYREAQLEAPEAAQPHFNAGDALFRQEAYEEAAKEFGRVVEGQSGDLNADAQYNLGNTLFRSQRLQEAVEAYKQALMHRPDDLDAKINLERAQLLLDQQKLSQEVLWKYLFVIWGLLYSLLEIAVADLGVIQERLCNFWSDYFCFCVRIARRI